MSSDLAFYEVPATMTDLNSIDESLLTGLPEDPAGICTVSNGLIVHEFLARAYGLESVEDRLDELEVRTVADLIAAINGLDPRPLAERRPPELRIVGNCRQFSVLTCSLLRHAHVAARCRAGFADYFETGMWVDHWIVEYWSKEDSRWVRADPQLDDVQHRILGFDFHPTDLPDGRFLDGSQAWRRCRAGDDDPERFGIQDLRGWWFIAGSVIRDLAALNKAETHTWDTLGRNRHNVRQARRYPDGARRRDRSHRHQRRCDRPAKPLPTSRPDHARHRHQPTIPACRAAPDLKEMRPIGEVELIDHRPYDVGGCGS